MKPLHWSPTPASRIERHEMIGDYKAQDPVAQELEALVVRQPASAAAGADAGVSQSLFKEVAIGNAVARRVSRSAMAVRRRFIAQGRSFDPASETIPAQVEPSPWLEES